MTQFGRALSERNIEILCANSSQAKGRVERMNRTRLGEVLAYVMERQTELDAPKVKSNSEKNGYVKRARGPGRRTDFMNDPAVIARREAAITRLDPRLQY